MTEKIVNGNFKEDHDQLHIENEIHHVHDTIKKYCGNCKKDKNFTSIGTMNEKQIFKTLNKNLNNDNIQ